MAHPGRVKRLVLIGVPGLPKTRCPLPIRLIAIPGMGELLSRLVPPSPKSVLRFASFVGEKATLAAHPDLVDLMVATGRDPIAAASARAVGLCARDSETARDEKHGHRKLPPFELIDETKSAFPQCLWRE
jgi:pimeloyl-ACP methyl ester carboxylesterase